MGAKTWMLVYSHGDAREALSRRPTLDRDATAKFVQSLFPGETLKLMGDGDLCYTNPPDNEIYAGCFPGVSVVAAAEFGIDYPSRLPAHFIAAGGGGTVTLHAMHSVVDWFAFARWEGGRLVRSLSLSPNSGILEDIGEKLPFEEPYWAGKHADIGDEDEKFEGPNPFHPLELAEAALEALFGYKIEGPAVKTTVDPEAIPLIHFKRSRAWWKFWK